MPKSKQNDSLVLSIPNKMKMLSTVAKTFEKQKLNYFTWKRESQKF